MDQRNCIEFCLKNEINCERTLEILIVAFSEFTMSRTQVQLWYNRFKEGLDVRCPSRPSTSKANENIEAVKKIFLDNR